jgi:hypothetical protein
MIVLLLFQLCDRAEAEAVPVCCDATRCISTVCDPMDLLPSGIDRSMIILEPTCRWWIHRTFLPCFCSEFVLVVTASLTAHHSTRHQRFSHRLLYAAVLYISMWTHAFPVLYSLRFFPCLRICACFCVCISLCICACVSACNCACICVNVNPGKKLTTRSNARVEVDHNLRVQERPQGFD